MEALLKSLKIVINDQIFLKDPESSKLGRRIVEESIKMIDSLGFEDFTFKKLGAEIGSNESSVYRYFENKHKLLLYLTSWYWGWLEYKLVFQTTNISDPDKKLEKAIEILTQTTEVDSNFSHIDEVLLNKIVINENSKDYLTKEVDMENREGYFMVYKRLVARMAEMIQEKNTQYPYALSLASTVIEGALHQHFLRKHFKNITNCDDTVSIANYFTHLVFSTIMSDSND